MKTSIVLLLASFSLVPFVARSEIKFFDGFESGKMLSTGTEGFIWSQIGGGDANKCNPSHCPVQGTSYEKNYSLMMGYLAGANWTERRYYFNRYYPEVWISYWIRVPTNYTHNSGSPSNNKFGCLYGSTYAEARNSVCWEMWPDGSNGSTLTANIASVGHGSEYTPFISVPSDRGRWMQVVFNVKASTTSSSANGYMKTWRRWDGEPSFTQIHNRVNVNIGYLNGWGNGYLMGYANVPYTQRTDWYIDNFTISTTNLLGSGNETVGTPTELILK